MLLGIIEYPFVAHCGCCNLMAPKLRFLRVPVDIYVIVAILDYYPSM